MNARLLIAICALCMNAMGQSLGSCGSGDVGLAAGAASAQSVLKVNNQAGGLFHRVDIFPSASITISVDQPLLNSVPARFVIFGAVGFPTASFAAPTPLSSTLSCFPFAPLAPNNPFLFTYADGFGGILPPALLPAIASPAPFSRMHPPLGVTGTFTLQGVIEDASGLLEITNAVIVNIVDPSVHPEVLEITTGTLGGADPATNSIPSNDTFRITFNEAIDLATLDPTETITVRNLSVTSPEQPGGMLVPVSVIPTSSGEVVILTPLSGLGAGPNQIEVHVGNTSTHIIYDQAFPGTLNSFPLTNSMAVVFTTQSTPAAPTPISVVERFDSTAFEDTSYQSRWNPATWDVASDRLTGEVLTGTALGASLGSPGNRTQYAVNNQSATVPPTTGYFSPFDDNGISNHGLAVNPNGGSRTQLLYLTLPQINEIPTQIADSIELVEWGAFGGNPNLAVYANFTMSLSHTSRSADPNVIGSPFGMSPVFAFNADFDNPQNAWINPGASPANLAPVTVVAPQPYVSAATATTFVPFPLLQPLFDFDANQTSINPVGGQTYRPNLLVDIDIAPPVQPSFNLIEGTISTGSIPIRRLVGPSGAGAAFAADTVAYRMRFTFVPRNASTTTLFHDVGSNFAAINWNSLQFFPSVASIPAGSVARVLVEGAPALSGSQPVGGSGWQEYIDRFGVVQPAALSAIGNARFVRFRFEFVSDTATNGVPWWDGFLLGGTF